MARLLAGRPPRMARLCAGRACFLKARRRLRRAHMKGGAGLGRRRCAVTTQRDLGVPQGVKILSQNVREEAHERAAGVPRFMKPFDDRARLELAAQQREQIGGPAGGNASVAKVFEIGR
jgi:hypothetical protein